MTGFQSRKPLRIEAGDEIGNCIATFPLYQLGGSGKSMSFCHGQHFFSMDHLIGRRSSQLGKHYRSLRLGLHFRRTGDGQPQRAEREQPS
jgi:hypothetical protein